MKADTPLLPAHVAGLVLVAACCLSTFVLPPLLLGTAANLVSSPAQVLMLFAMVQLPVTILSFTPPSKITSSLLWSAVGIAAGTPTLYSAYVLFGAPFLSQAEDTLSFSVATSVMAVVPGACLLRGDGAAMHRLYFRRKPQTSYELLALAGTYGTLFGAWLGAFAIPLDWDRPWQPWPISSAYGSIAAFSLATAGASALILIGGDVWLLGKKLKTG